MKHLFSIAALCVAALVVRYCVDHAPRPNPPRATELRVAPQTRQAAKPQDGLTFRRIEMSNMLAAGVAWLNSQRAQFLSQTGVYQRGAFQIPALAATRGKTDFSIDTGSTMRVESNAVDWIVTTADLVLNGQPIEPERGDSYTVNGEVYETYSPDPNSQPYTLDPTGLQTRIHMKRVA